MRWLIRRLVHNAAIWLDVRVNRWTYVEAMRRHGFTNVDSMTTNQLYHFFRWE